MRRKDLLTILVITIVAGFFAWLIGGFVFSYQADSNQIKKLAPISPAFESLDQRFFNERSINPTIRTIIGTSDEQN